MNNDQPKIFILIPAYNEEKRIGQTIWSLKDKGYSDILIINDGSSDNTAAVAKAAGVEVLNHIINRGQGAALKTGLEYLREEYDPDIIITFDADGQHRTEDLERFIGPIANNEAEIVLGSRFLKNKSKIPFFRKIILKSGVVFTRLISNVPVTDTHNGFRAFGKKAIRSIRITQRGMEHASEIIDEIGKNKLSFKEVPVEIIYSEYSLEKGQKNSNFIKIGLKTLFKKLL